MPVLMPPRMAWSKPPSIWPTEFPPPKYDVGDRGAIPYAAISDSSARQDVAQCTLSPGLPHEVLHLVALIRRLSRPAQQVGTGRPLGAIGGEAQLVREPARG